MQHTLFATTATAQPGPAPDVAAAARRWLGVRWQHQGRDRAGVDCAGLAIAVAQEVRGSTFDFTGYARLASDETMLALCDQMLVRRPGPQHAQVGDVLVMRFDSQRHMAICAAYVWGGLSIVHAHAPSRRVVEHRLDDAWLARTIAAFGWPSSVGGAV